MHNVLVIILGGGQGTRLSPLTAVRSKPAVPIGGKYRLIDIPISNCLHADLRRIFVLTQFNSASLNRHISQSYRLDLFSQGFVEILAAEQTPDGHRWFQGTADAVRQALRHIASIDADYYLILAGDHIYRMDYRDLIGAHISTGAEITIAAQPVTADDATSMGILRFDSLGRIEAFEEKPNAARLAEIGASVPASGGITTPADKPFVASMGIYVFSRRTLLDVLSAHTSVDFGKEVIPAALSTHRVHAHLFDGYWADVGTLASFYAENIQLTRPRAPFNFYDPKRPIYTHARFLPGSRFNDCAIERSIVAEGSFLEQCRVTESVVGIRSHIYRGSTVTRCVILGADYYEAPEEARARQLPPLGIGRNVVLDRVIVDKNARIGDDVRLVNASGVADGQGDGYVIRQGIIVVPKNAVVKPGTSV